MDTDSNTPEQSTPPESRASWQSFLDRFNRVSSLIIVFIMIATAITGLVLYQSGLKSEMVKLQAEIQVVKIEVKSEVATVRSEINRLEQKVDSLEQKIDIRFDAIMEQFKAMNSRFDALEQVFTTTIDYLDKQTDENAKAIDTIRQTLNESSN